MQTRQVARAATVAAMVALGLAATASPALAKGPDQATITGPGLAKPIVVTGLGEPGSGSQLADLADGSGLFMAMFGEPGLTAQAPTASLGARYTLTHRVPTGTPTAPTVEQDLYPLAAGGPVTYTRAGQSVFTGQSTVAGWYRAPVSFTNLLAELRVPGVRAAAAGVTTPATATPASDATAPSATATPAAPAGALATPAAPRRSPLLLIVGSSTALALLLGGGLLLRRRQARSPS